MNKILFTLGAVIAFTMVGTANAVYGFKPDSNKLCQKCENHLAQTEAKVSALA